MDSSNKDSVFSFPVKHLHKLVIAITALSSLCMSEVPATESPGAVAWDFTEASANVGLDYSHSYESYTEIRSIANGLAIGDLNNDGWDDLFVVTGNSLSMGLNGNPNKLYIAQADGTFSEASAAWGLSSNDTFSAGPLIFDFNGDGWNDLLVGGVGDNRIRAYKNTGGNAFSDNTALSNLLGSLNTINNMSMASADIDLDGDLDLFVAHWISNNQPMLFSNSGTGHFVDVTTSKMTGTKPYWVFTPAFVDLNNDNRLDLALTNDFLNASMNLGGSRYYLFEGSANQFVNQGLPIPKSVDPFQGPDENGMGGAFGDYDNDGDMDWFVSSIWDTDGVTEGNWGVSGNRLYNNDGNGNFTDVTDTAGVRVGYWGWGSCFADFNNDGHLDLYHVNGFEVITPTPETEFVDDPARMFINNGDGTFSEQSASLGVNDTGQGRAILCFDNDRDGDIDILVSNNRGDSRFFRNNLSNGYHWIEIKLLQDPPNHEAIGAKVRVTVSGLTQIRQVLSGGSFASSHPSAQHFGLGVNTMVNSIEVTWPDGQLDTWLDVAADQYLVLQKPKHLIFQDSFEEVPLW